MKKLLNISLAVLLSVCSTTLCFGFQSDNNEVEQLKEMINFMVGGTWESENANNEGKPEDFKSFFMKFEQWHDENSVKGSIYGVTNNSDTTGIMEVWNFVDYVNTNIKLIQRTTWNAYSEGTIVPYQGKHLDIQFKTIMADGQSYYTRDLHIKETENRLRAEQYHKREEDDEWQKGSVSIWVRKENQSFN